MNISKHTFSVAIFSGKKSIIFSVYLHRHRDVQPVWNKYRLAGTNDSHQPEHEDSNFPARLSSIVGEERWCGVVGAGMCGVHMLYIHTVITPSCCTMVMVDTQWADPS